MINLTNFHLDFLLSLLAPQPKNPPNLLKNPSSSFLTFGLSYLILVTAE
jgi:hypothetical protein